MRSPRIRAVSVPCTLHVATACCACCMSPQHAVRAVCRHSMLCCAASQVVIKTRRFGAGFETLLALSICRVLDEFTAGDRGTIALIAHCRHEFLPCALACLAPDSPTTSRGGKPLLVELQSLSRAESSRALRRLIDARWTGGRYGSTATVCTCVKA